MKEVFTIGLEPTNFIFKINVLPLHEVTLPVTIHFELLTRIELISLTYQVNVLTNLNYKSIKK